MRLDKGNRRMIWSRQDTAQFRSKNLGQIQFRSKNLDQKLRRKIQGIGDRQFSHSGLQIYQALKFLIKQGDFAALLKKLWALLNP